MKLGQFRYKVPEELIAQYPAHHRDESRLMVVHKKSGKIEHKMFKDLLNYFEEGDVLVNNNTRVFPARMYGNKEKSNARFSIDGDRADPPENAGATMHLYTHP